MSANEISVKLKVWRQSGPDVSGYFEDYEVPNVSVDMSFLEMLDVLNETLIKDEKDPIAFDHDCREGICGSCGAMVNGRAHGPQAGVALCQLHMRSFKDGDDIVLEPFRAKAFPVQKDLMVNRQAFDRIIESGGYISVKTGSASEANATLVSKLASDNAFDAATCIGCGACVAACPNASASLFVGAKVTQLSLLPQGHPERERRVVRMVKQMDDETFGACSNAYQCEGACPKEISVDVIAQMNRELIRTGFNDCTHA